MSMDIPVDGDELNRCSPPASNASGSSQKAKSDTSEAPQSMCLSASSTTMETIKFKHRWTIDQFSVQQELSQVAESLESSPFGTKDENYRFRLKLFPCGKDEECRGYLSLFLQIHKCPQSKLRFRVNFYLDTTEGPRGCALNRNVVIINKGGIVTASKFFSMDTLKSRASIYVPNDVLTVGVDLTVFGEQTSKELDNRGITKHDELAPEMGTLVHDITELYRDMVATDVTLNVDDHIFEAHSALLMARSPVFAAMFRHSTTEREKREIVIEDCTVDAIEALIEFIYTDQCRNLERCGGDVLAAADKYGVLRLKQMCEQHLCTDLSVENVCERLRIADSYSAALLRRNALVVLEQHKQQVLTSQAWSELEQACPMLAAIVLKELMTSDANNNNNNNNSTNNSQSTTTTTANKTPQWTSQSKGQSSANVLLYATNSRILPLSRGNSSSSTTSLTRHHDQQVSPSSATVPSIASSILTKRRAVSPIRDSRKKLRHGKD